MRKQEFIDKHFRGCSPEYFDIVSSDLDAVIAGDKVKDEFIDKHIKIVMAKTADAMIDSEIGKMFGSIEMASVQYFLETGKINGSFHSRIKHMMMRFAMNWHNAAFGSETAGSGENHVDDERALEPIQDAIYATGRFTTADCDKIANGIIDYLRTAGMNIYKSTMTVKK